MNSVITVDRINKKYGNKTVLEDVSFKIEKGEFLSILGPSGCGKTTLLRLLIGIEKQDSGFMYKTLPNGEQIEISNFTPYQRNIGIVFQNYALFPNMTVLDNVMYALKLKLKNKELAKKSSLKMIKMVNMEEHINKYPHQLSGGQQQRVAIARTLALKPDIICIAGDINRNIFFGSTITDSEDTGG